MHDLTGYQYITFLIVVSMLLEVSMTFLLSRSVLKLLSMMSYLELQREDRIHSNKIDVIIIHS